MFLQCAVYISNNRTNFTLQATLVERGNRGEIATEKLMLALGRYHSLLDIDIT